MLLGIVKQTASLYGLVIIIDCILAARPHVQISITPIAMLSLKGNHHNNNAALMNAQNKTNIQASSKWP